MGDPKSESLWDWCRVAGATKGQCDVRHIKSAKGHRLATACATHGACLTFGGPSLYFLASGTIPLDPESRVFVERVAESGKRYECLECHGDFPRDGTEWNRILGGGTWCPSCKVPVVARYKEWCRMNTVPAGEAIPRKAVKREHDEAKAKAAETDKED